jgi:riboflavin kinase / FMN adenylyltransferase
VLIHRTVAELRRQFVSPVATIGNFDGVHLGHREIFRRVKREAAAVGGESVIVTFIPHPLKVLAPERSPLLVNTYEEKELLMEASGIDHLVTIPFTREFASVTATDFVRDILVAGIGVRRIVIGHDYAFGRNREGSVDFLCRAGRELGFEVEVLEPIGNGDEPYSSSRIRRMISAGELREVVNLLGRHYSLGGEVIHGHNRGKGLGFPTANLRTEKELIPADGVYAVKVKIDGAEVLDGACNIGTNPTFGDDGRSIEVFLFDFVGDLYGKEMRIYFIDRIREERKFPDAEALRAAIAADIARCREILDGASIIEYREYLEQI